MKGEILELLSVIINLERFDLIQSSSIDLIRNYKLTIKNRTDEDSDYDPIVSSTSSYDYGQALTSFVNVYEKLKGVTSANLGERFDKIAELGRNKFDDAFLVSCNGM
nr:unnamed protein product [Callosobruchus analis]